MTTLRKFWGPIALALVILATTACSVGFIREEIAPFRPIFIDQDVYLDLAYSYSDAIRKEGILPVIQAHFTHDISRLGFMPSVNSQMSLIAGILFSIFEEGRLTALSIHLFSWALLAITLYFVVQRLTRQTGYALAAVGFLLFLGMPHVAAGGMVDFRLDFVASCWIGMAAAWWVLFLHRPAALYAWLAAGTMAILIFFRIITSVYLVLPLGLLALLALHSLLTGRRKGLRRSIAPLLVFGLYALTLVIWDWNFLHSYYIEHQLGNEITARGLDKTWDNVPAALLYYPLSLLKKHFGLIPLFGLLTAIAVSAGLFVAGKKKTAPPVLLPIRRSAIIFCVCAVVFPVLVLIANPTRAPQVVGVSSVALALTGFLLFLSFRPRHQTWPVPALGFTLLLTGAFCWNSILFAHAPYKNDRRTEAIVLNSVLEKVFQELIRDPKLPATFAVLDFQEALIGWGVGIYGREQLHSSQKVSCLFPMQMFTMEPDAILQKFRAASVVILPHDSAILAKRPYPVSKSMLESYPLIKADVEKRMQLQSSFTYEGVAYDLFFSR